MTVFWHPCGNPSRPVNTTLFYICRLTSVSKLCGRPFCFRGKNGGKTEGTKRDYVFYYFANHSPFSYRVKGKRGRTFIRPRSIYTHVYTLIFILHVSFYFVSGNTCAYTFLWQACHKVYYTSPSMEQLQAVAKKERKWSQTKSRCGLMMRKNLPRSWD